MKISRTFITVLAATWLSSAVSTTAFGDVLFYNSEKSSDSSTSSSDKDAESDLSSAMSMVENLLEAGKMTAEEIRDLGPGYAAALDAYDTWASENHRVGSKGKLEEEKEADYSGPVVTKVELKQVYHSDYETYEFSIADEYFFYANVGNGELTDKTVKIDFPTNLTYTVEKDGLPYAYESKQSIAGKGTYVVKLMAIENQDAPLSEQKEYQAVFRFRIQDKPPAEKTEESEKKEVSGKTAAIWEDTDSVSEEPVRELEAEIEAETVQETEAESSAETEAALEAEAEPAASDMVSNVALISRSQHFDAESGNYVITLENGKELTASVPEGYIGSGSVFLHVSESDAAETKLYKDDELVEFANDTSVTEYGQYRVDLNGYSCFFTLAKEVGQMDYYPAPAGMKFTEVYLNDEVLPLASEHYAELSMDGTYAFVMSGEAGERLEVVLKKDTIAPEMNIILSKNTAAIQYLSDDITTVELIKNGTVVSGFGGTSITEPGKYTLTISDAAGNCTSKSFSLSYQVNMYGVLAVMLIILTIIGIVVFVIYTKRNTKVR